MFEKALYLNYSDEVLEAVIYFISSHFVGCDPLEAQARFLSRVKNAQSLSVRLSSETNIARKHITIACEVISIRALPFLSDELRELLSQLERDLSASWTNLVMAHKQIGEHAQSLDKSVFEKIDSLTVTFLEWISDVDFFSFAESEQRRLLTEFPFN